MDKLIIHPTNNSPQIYFDYDAGLIEIRGRSVPENGIKFFEPLFEWVKKYIQHPKPQTVVKVFIEYFNTSSSKNLLQIFKILESVHGKTTHVRMQWYFHDDDMEEIGEDYQMLVKVPFEFYEADL